jgi:putative ABC transport system permease protein
MPKVKNGACIRHLSARSLRATKGRNIAAVLAIALTALLFTGVLTVGMSLMDLMQQNTMRQVGTSTHGGFKFLTQAQYDKIAADSAVKDISYTIYLGQGENPELHKTYTEIRYAEPKAAEWNFYLPTTGRLPEAENEAACSTAVLDALGVPHELGQSVTLEFTSQNVHYEDTFTLCGFWEQDTAVVANTVLVSRAYCDRVAPMPAVPLEQLEIPDGADYNSYMAGYLNPSLWFASSWDLDGQMAALKERCGFGPEVNDGVNWAYGSATVDFETIALVAGLLLLIIVSGYLIIYNIFAISVARDIRFYGLLKTIGTTGRQLRRIVRRQALLLSIIGIPAGLVLGWLAAKVLTPLLLAASSYGRFMESMETSANPAIFVGGALLALITVVISCARPCRMAARVSPVEAVRWTGAKQPKRGKRRARRVSPLSMALANFRRTPGKTVLVILSLSLSLILLNTVYTAVRGFDMDKYLQNTVVTDFLLTDASMINVGSGEHIQDAIEPAHVAAVAALPGVEGSGRVYLANGYRHHFGGVGLERIQNYVEWRRQEGNLLSPYTDEDVRMLTEEQTAWMQLYGVEEFPFSKLEVYRGELDWEVFSTGEYILVGPSIGYDDPDKTADSAYYQPGETVAITWPDGQEVDYEVLAIAEIPYALGPMYSFNFSSDLIVPASEYLAHMESQGALNLAFDVDDANEDAVQQWIEDYTEGTDLSYKSKATYEEGFQSMADMIAGVGGALAGVLALIGVLNFVNAVVTSIVTRRRELAMLQSVGMTGGQLSGMLMWEGLLYVLATLLVTVTAGSALCYGLVNLLTGQMWYFSYQFTLLPVALCTPVMIAVAVAVPLLAYRFMCRDSVVERLRETE